MENSKSSSSKIYQILALSLMGPIVFMLQFFDHISGTYNETFTVIKNDASNECRRRRGFLKPRIQSDAPENGFGHYCGLIRTTHGAYLLIESGDDFFLNDSRPEMDKLLQIGCTVTVKIIGWGDKYDPQKGQNMPVTKMISKILKIHSCP